MNNLPCYIWDTQEGSKAESQEVSHCYCMLRWEIWDYGPQAGCGGGGEGRGGMSPQHWSVVRQWVSIYLVASSPSHRTKGSTVAPSQGQPTHIISLEWPCVGESWEWHWDKMAKRRVRRVKPEPQGAQMQSHLSFGLGGPALNQASPERDMRSFLP